MGAKRRVVGGAILVILAAALAAVLVVQRHFRVAPPDRRAYETRLLESDRSHLRMLREGEAGATVGRAPNGTRFFVAAPNLAFAVGGRDECLRTAAAAWGDKHDDWFEVHKSPGGLVSVVGYANDVRPADPENGTVRVRLWPGPRSDCWLTFVRMPEVVSARRGGEAQAAYLDLEVLQGN